MAFLSKTLYAIASPQFPISLKENSEYVLRSVVYILLILAVIHHVSCHIITLNGPYSINPRAPQGNLNVEGATLSTLELYDSTLISLPAIENASGDEVEIGRKLFSGEITFLNSGPPCMTCHHVTEENLQTGGETAPDLTDVYTRLGRENIYSRALTPKYPAMQLIYNNNPITKKEASYLVAYFEYVSTQGTHQEEQNQRAADVLNRIKKSNTKKNRHSLTFDE